MMATQLLCWASQFTKHSSGLLTTLGGGVFGDSVPFLLMRRLRLQWKSDAGALAHTGPGLGSACCLAFKSQSSEERHHARQTVRKLGP